MNEKGKAALVRLSTGVPGLDDVLGGGLPEYSFNLIAGEPGSGKTTLAHQIVFANASSEKRVLYVTVLGEPPLKMLRYMQQMTFFDIHKVGELIRFVDLSQEVLERDLSKILDKIVQHVKDLSPAFVVVDSFRSVVRARVTHQSGEMELQSFLQSLGVYLTSWEATTFLVGEYLEAEMPDNPIFTIADAILWLTQAKDRNSMVRKFQVMKLRGQASMPGLHTFRITQDGLQIFPRLHRRMQTPGKGKPDASSRLSTGVVGLDKLFGGGIPQGDALLVAGPSGTGKTCFCTQFIAAGAERNEPGVIVVFEENPVDYLIRAKNLGFDFQSLLEKGMLRVVALRPLDLSVDETLQELRQAVEEINATRLVIDSLSGFEVALAPNFRDDFRESLYRMVGSLTSVGVTIVMTVEVVEAFAELRLSPHQVSFLTEDIVLLRYAEIEGALKKVLTIIKMRRSNHSNDLYEFEIGSNGIMLKEPLTRYEGILTGTPKLSERSIRPAYPGLTDEEGVALKVLLEGREIDEKSIAAATGLKGPALARALHRLVTLNYAIKIDENGRTLYRPLARVLGQ